MENEEEGLDIRSESIQDIIGTNPPMMVRWGNTMMFVVCSILISLCWLIKYPDTIPSQITIKTNITPKPITAKQEGKLIKVLVKDGELVKAGAAVGYIESLSDVKTILMLEDQLHKIDSVLIKEDWESLTKIDFIKFNRFGEIQNDFETFFISFQTLKALWKGEITANKIKLIQNEINNLNSLNKNIEEQEYEAQRDLMLAEEEYKTNLNLYADNVISLSEMRTFETKYIAKKLVLKQIHTNILSNNNYKYSSNKQLIDINQNIEQEKINFIKVFNILKNELANWKNNFILTAPETGKISFAGSVEEFQSVTKGQDLFYIIPDNINYYGEVNLDQNNLGKVENNQRVIIKLKSFPFEEYGIVRGEVENISEVEVNEKYLVRVKLPNGIKTNLNKQLKFRFGMLGDVEIITKNERIIDKILYKLKKI